MKYNYYYGKSYNDRGKKGIIRKCKKVVPYVVFLFSIFSLFYLIMISSIPQKDKRGYFKETEAHHLKDGKEIVSLGTLCQGVRMAKYNGLTDNASGTIVRVKKEASSCRIHYKDGSVEDLKNVILIDYYDNTKENNYMIELSKFPNDIDKLYNENPNAAYFPTRNTDYVKKEIKGNQIILYFNGELKPLEFE